MSQRLSDPDHIFCDPEAQDDSQLGINFLVHDDTMYECTLVQRAGPEDRERWARVRASGPWLYGPRPQKGLADGTVKALKAAHGRTFHCATPGCAALVDLESARRLARAAGRDFIAPGDGCSSALCSAHYAPSRFHERQAIKAMRLLRRERVLVLKPPTTAARVDLWAVPHVVSHAIAYATLAHVRAVDPRAMAAARAVIGPGSLRQTLITEFYSVCLPASEE